MGMISICFIWARFLSMAFATMERLPYVLVQSVAVCLKPAFVKWRFALNFFMFNRFVKKGGMGYGPGLILESFRLWRLPRKFNFAMLAPDYKA